MRWEGTGVIKNDGQTIIHSGNEAHTSGLGIILDQKTAKMFNGTWAISDRVLLDKVKNKHKDLSIIQVYAPTSSSTEAEIGRFYDELEIALKQCKFKELKLIKLRLHSTLFLLR